MLVIPMKTHRDEIIGVLQLINRKRDAGATARRRRRSSSARCCRYDQRAASSS